MGQLQTLRTGEDKLQRITIMEAASCLKVMHYPADQQEEVVKAALRYVFSLIGLKNLPDQTATAVLVEFIISEHKTLSPEEIIKAFRMYAKNELDDAPDLYQNFNSLYFSRVIESYRRAKAAQVKKARSGTHQAPEISEEEKLKITEEYFIKCLIEPYQNRTAIWSPSLMFKKLERIGVIQIPKEEKKELMSSARNLWEERLKNASSLFDQRGSSAILRAVVEDGMNLSQKEEVKDIARELALNQWIDEQRKKKITHTDLQSTVLEALHLSPRGSGDKEGQDGDVGVRTDEGGSDQGTEEKRGGDL